MGRETPVLVDLKPSGQHYMEHFHAAGGMATLAARAEAAAAPGRADRHRPHAGRGTGARQGPGFAQDVVRPRTNPIYPQAASRCCTATWRPAAPSSSSRRPTRKLMEHEGRAVVFEDAADLAARIDSDARRHRRRRAGAEEHRPKGAPGMPEAGYIPLPRKLARQGVKDMVRISDGRMSGTAFGTIVLHVTPESADRRAAGLGAQRRPHPLSGVRREMTCW
jgi:dihydroxy-acid dehydratase